MAYKYETMHQIYILHYFWVSWICIFKRYFLIEQKMALLSVILLDEMKSLVLTKRKTHQEISNIFKERFSDMWGLSAINVRRFCNENAIRTWTTLNDSEIKKEVTKSIAQVNFAKHFEEKCCSIHKHFCKSIFHSTTTSTR